MRPPKGGVASRKHPRCWPPVHWLQGRFVCCQRVTLRTIWCCPSCHPGHPLVHLVWTVLLHRIHKEGTRPPGHHFCRLVSLARPVSSPIPRPSVSVSQPFINLPPRTAYIFDSTALSPQTRSQFPAFCYKVSKSHHHHHACRPAVCRGPLFRAALTVDRLARRSNTAFNTCTVLQGATGPLLRPGRRPPQSAVQDPVVLNSNRSEPSSRDSSQCSNY